MPEVFEVLKNLLQDSYKVEQGTLSKKGNLKTSA